MADEPCSVLTIDPEAHPLPAGGFEALEAECEGFRGLEVKVICRFVKQQQGGGRWQEQNFRKHEPGAETSREIQYASHCNIPWKPKLPEMLAGLPFVAQEVAFPQEQVLRGSEIQKGF